LLHRFVWDLLAGFFWKNERREGKPVTHSGTTSTTPPFVVTITTEYKYGEIAELIGKLGKFIWSMFCGGCRGLGRSGD
jgi:hypothetical protein